MHIGTARTALFNYLYARKHGGKFKVRVEDTDKSRNDESVIDPIITGMNWLGLDRDGPIVFQSLNEARHVEVVHALLGKGMAYLCYLTPDETAAMKTQGTAFRSPYRDPVNLTPDLVRRISSDDPHVIRFKGPTDGAVVVKDMVRGDVTFDASNFDDLVLLRSDGTPTYNLAVVVDDHDMKVSHVIRGDDHLNNAGRQQLIYQAMGWTVPVWAHIPLIHDAKGKKLSKRSGDAVSIEDFISLGYEKDAMFNYLCRLGWGGDGTEEIFSKDYAIDRFDLAAIVKSPARLDMNKLNSINVHYLRERNTNSIILGTALAVAKEHGLTGDEMDMDAIMRAAPVLVDGATTINDMAKIVWFAANTDLPMPDDKALTAMVESMADLPKLITCLGESEDWSSPEILGDLVRKYSEDSGIPMKAIGPVVRAAITGKTSAPDIGTLLYSVGKEKALERLRAASRYA